MEILYVDFPIKSPNQTSLYTQQKCNEIKMQEEILKISNKETKPISQIQLYSRMEIKTFMVIFQIP